MRQMKDGTKKEQELVSFGTPTQTFALLALVSALGLIGFLAAGSIARSATGTSHATVSLRKTKLGSVLVNSSGHTLYMFAKDRNGKSSCNATCAGFWPPLIRHGKPTVGPGVKASLLGTTRRSNGSVQVTYNKHPLYGFSLDKRAGQTNGEGRSAFGGRWYAVSANGTAVHKPPPTTTTTNTTTSSCLYPPC
jgi:predicted lipoprotein with Yx(FWY)xxD motif